MKQSPQPPTANICNTLPVPAKAYLLVLLLFLGQNLSAQITALTDYFTPEEIAAANTAKEATYMTLPEREVFLYNNLVRMYPKKFHKLYYDYLDPQRYERDNLLRNNNFYRSLSQLLRTMEPVGPLHPSYRDYKLAACWAEESGRKGKTGHNRKECPPAGGENCAYGYRTPIDMVMGLLIDRSTPSLGHRISMLSDTWKGMGTAIRRHKSYGIVLVQDFNTTSDYLQLQIEERKKLLATLHAKWTPEELSQASPEAQSTLMNNFEKSFYQFLNLYRLFPEKFAVLYIENGLYFDQTLESLQADKNGWQDIIDFAQRVKAQAPMPPMLLTDQSVRYGRCATLQMNQKNKFGFRGVKCPSQFAMVQASSGVGPDAYDTLIAYLTEKYEVLHEAGIEFVFSPGRNFNVTLEIRHKSID